MSFCSGYHLQGKSASLIRRHTVDGRNPAPPQRPWKVDSPVNTNEQWFQPWLPSGAKWILSIHGINSASRSLRVRSQGPRTTVRMRPVRGRRGQSQVRGIGTTVAFLFGLFRRKSKEEPILRVHLWRKTVQGTLGAGIRLRSGSLFELHYAFRSMESDGFPQWGQKPLSTRFFSTATAGSVCQWAGQLLGSGWAGFVAGDTAGLPFFWRNLDTALNVTLKIATS